MQICTVPTVLTARRRLAAALNAEGADGLSNANTVETSIPAAFVAARAQPQRCPHSYSTVSVAHGRPLALKAMALLRSQSGC